MFTDAIPLALTNSVLMLFIVSLLWVISRLIKDPSFIDSFWSLGFLIVTVVSFLVSGQLMEPQLTLQKLLLVMVVLWSLRLSGHLFIRWRKEGLDKRYATMLKRWEGKEALYSYLYIFILQGALIIIISAPLQWVMIETIPVAWTPLTITAVGLFAFGLLFETIGDAQLTDFKADPANKGKVMDKGLWRYTRHPNYFGDACVWWGFYLLSLETSFGVYSLFAPIIMTFLLTKVSGVPLLEHGLKKHRPDYADYIKRTSGFIPMPPKAKEKD